MVCGVAKPVRSPVGAGNHHAGKRIAEAVPDTVLRTSTEVTRVFVKRRSQQNASEEILAGQIRHGSAEALAVGSPSFAVLGITIVGLRYPSAQGSRGDGSWIIGLSDKKYELFVESERFDGLVGIGNGLVVGENSENALVLVVRLRRRRGGCLRRNEAYEQGGEARKSNQNRQKLQSPSASPCTHTNRHFMDEPGGVQRYIAIIA